MPLDIQQPKLPQKFTSHPENSVGLLTVEFANQLIDSGLLTTEGAIAILPNKTWTLIRGNGTNNPQNWITLPELVNHEY